jgi:predicted  nucleic acid-binding Zn-ribbon protein
LRDRERAEEDRRTAKKNISEWEREIKDIENKMMNASSSKDYQFYESEIRRLNEQIGWEHQWIEDLENYFRQLDEDDNRHQEYLDEVENEKLRGELEKNQGRIDSLEESKEFFQEKQGEANQAK